MNKDFKNEIIAIALSNKERDKKLSKTKTANSDDDTYIDVIEDLFSISESAVNIYNSNSKTDVLSVYMLPEEFLELFLEIPGRRGGFCIISPVKIVIFFDEDPNLITVIGKKRNTESGKNNAGFKASQLIKVSFSNEEGTYIYKDNTGGRVNPYDIVSLLVKWVVSG